MHIIWNGSINFGLVNIPIKLYNAADDRVLHFSLLHNADKSPINYAKICRLENKQITSKEIVKGYEYKKDHYIILTEKDFKEADKRATHVIDVISFIKEDEIDSRYYHTPYYLEPGKNADNSYALLREAIKKSKKIALAKFVLRNREHLAIIKTIDNALVLQIIRFADEVRKVTALDVPSSKSLNSQHVEIALTLIDKMTTQFVPNEFHDTYTQKLQDLIAAKLKGKQYISKEKLPRQTKVKDLMADLKASLKKVSAKPKVRARRKVNSRKKKAA